MRKMTATHVNYLVLHLLLIALGVICVLAGGTVNVAIGTSLIATGSAGGVLFFYVLLSATTARKVELVSNFGFVDAFTTRSAAIKERYDERLLKARTSIDILGFGLSHLRHDYLKDFETWSLKAKVRILLMDPAAPDGGHSYADQRDKEEDNPADTIRKDVQTFLETTKDLRTRRPDRFQIRLFTSLPSVNIFKVDDEMFWGPYLVRRQSRNTSTFIVRRGGQLFLQLEEHFEALWGDEFSRPVDENAGA